MRPDEYPEWGTADITQVIDLREDGNLVSLDNKQEPTAEWKASGQLYKVPTPYQYINYNFDLINDWVVHLNEGVAGDYKVMPSTTTVVEVEARFGGAWVDRGTDTLAGQSIRLFEKTV